jgi:hypothetical protein
MAWLALCALAATPATLLAQIVLSPDAYLNVAPGPPKDDTTILEKTP